jgi:hypothetical protein
LRRTTNLPVNATGWAWGFWFRKTAAIGSGVFENLIEIGDASGNYLKLYLDGTAQDLRWQASGGTFEDVSLFTPTNGTWYFVCLRTASATTGDILWRAATATSLTASSGRNFGASTWTKMFFANNEGGLEPTANTELAALKIFVGTLSDALVWEQSARLLPRCDAAILDSYLPLYTNSGADEGGRARNWTVTATLAAVSSSPNVARGGVGRGRFHRPTAAAAATLPIATAAAAALALNVAAVQPVSLGVATAAAQALSLTTVAVQPVTLPIASASAQTLALTAGSVAPVTLPLATAAATALAPTAGMVQPVTVPVAAATATAPALSASSIQPVVLPLAAGIATALALVAQSTNIVLPIAAGIAVALSLTAARSVFGRTAGGLWQPRRGGRRGR